MKENVGKTDRWIRIAVATALGAAGVRSLQKNKKRKNGKKVAPAALLAGSAALFESAMTRVCPINGMLGIDTRSFDRKRKDEKNREESRTDRDERDVVSARAGEAASAAAAH